MRLGDASNTIGGSTMTDPIAVEMYKQVLEACAAEHDQLAGISQLLDSKAQATAATSGIFIAASFAFVQDITVKLPTLYIAFLGPSIGLLLLSVFFAILGMWLQRAIGRPTAEFVQKLILDLLKKVGPDDIGTRAGGFYGDQVHEWLPALQRLRIVVKRKSRFVVTSQLFLLLALVSISILTVIYILKGV
jgi:hypothetical protein